MKKKKKLLLAGLMLVLFLCGCQEKAPDETQMKQALEESGYVTSLPYMEGMNIESLTIDRAQEDKEHVNAYCVAELKNELKSATAYVRMRYDYYSKGGWILEECDTWQETEFAPLTGVDQSAVEMMLAEQNYNLSSIREENLDLENGLHIWSFIFTREEEVCTITGEGIVTYTFTPDGWECVEVQTGNEDYAFHLDGRKIGVAIMPWGMYGVRNCDINIIEMKETTMDVMDDLEYLTVGVPPYKNREINFYIEDGQLVLDAIPYSYQTQPHTMTLRMDVHGKLKCEDSHGIEIRAEIEE